MKQKNSPRQFKGVWIPASLYMATDLTWSHKLMLIEIDSFSKNKLDCFVSNEHLADHLQLSKSGTEKVLKHLVDIGLVQRERRKIGKVYRRVLRVVTSIEGDIQPYLTEATNHLQVGTTNTRTKPTTKPKKEGQPSTEGECIEYFLELGMSVEEAQKFLDWYEQTGWKLKGGNKIKDWKATARNWKRRQKEHQNEKRGFSQDNFNSEALHRYVTEG